VANCRQLSRQGISAKERGEWGRAEQLLSQAVESCPVDADARRQYAEALWHRGATQEALAQLEEARRLAGDDTTLVVRQGELYLGVGQFDAARTAAEQALDLDPKLASAWALRGKALQAAGDSRQALADFQRSLGYEPGNPEVLLEVAEAHRRLNQPERALAALQSLLDTYPPGEEPQQALYLQGLALTALGRYNAAIESFSLSAQRGKPTPDILCSLGEVELLAGRDLAARSAAEQALALEPRHAPSQTLLSKLPIAGGGPLRR
jgi:tetratricopeptide (TPR) repeat protein